MTSAKLVPVKGKWCLKNPSFLKLPHWSKVRKHGPLSGVPWSMGLQLINRKGATSLCDVLSAIKNPQIVHTGHRGRCWGHGLWGHHPLSSFRGSLLLWLHRKCMCVVKCLWKHNVSKGKELSTILILFRSQFQDTAFKCGRSHTIPFLVPYHDGHLPLHHFGLNVLSICIIAPVSGIAL